MPGDRVERWSERWEKGNTRWHNKDVNYSLLHHGGLLLPSPHLRVFYDAGHTVVGIEAVEKGVLEFFSEQNLSYSTEQLSWGKLHKTKDDRLSIYCSDMMKVDVAALGKFDAVWDRGSLVAIYEEDRECYVQIMKSLLAPDFRYLLNVTQYTPDEFFSGPPRNVPRELIEQFFGDMCKIELLESVKWPEEDERIANWNLKSMTEAVFILSPNN
ncbi:probable thiopurine S-methyltransferase isoform X2 [Homarus americanus]|uniref:probable thiopurine S-methyltransferase isoform X2 n=1 Tax=Homarus americanus TaxID=6706 RepID=UPI001C4452D8|nr:probable thiopurine S-methyltransferase isoform X2 [Homarus americanus]